MLTLTQAVLWHEGDYSGIPIYVLNETVDSELERDAKRICDLALRSLSNDWWHAEPAAMHLGVDVKTLGKLLSLAAGDRGAGQAYEVFWEWSSSEDFPVTAGFRVQQFQEFPPPGSFLYHSEHCVCVVVMPALQGDTLEVIPMKTLWTGEPRRLRLKTDAQYRRLSVPIVGELRHAEAALSTWRDAAYPLNDWDIGACHGGQPLDSAAWARSVWGGTHGELNPQHAPRYCPPWHPNKNLTYFRDGSIGCFIKDTNDAALPRGVNTWDSIAEYESELEEESTR